jgi:hypothetical protein
VGKAMARYVARLLYRLLTKGQKYVGEWHASSINAAIVNWPD